MGIWSSVRNSIAFGFQPKRWIGWEHIIHYKKICQNLFTSVSQFKQPMQGMDPLQNDTHVQKRKKLAFVLIWIYGVIGFSLLLYGIVLFSIFHLILNACFCVVLALLFWIYCLHEILVYWQIRLGPPQRPLMQLIRLICGQSRK